MRACTAFTIVLTSTLSAGAQTGTPAPSKIAKAIPATRWEMKQALEALKNSQPRLPLPPDDGGGKGVNNGRMRAFYVPAELREGCVGGFGGGFGKGKGKGDFSLKPADPKEAVERSFNTMLFWIVSRVNNCHY